jgi:hypothetical protein
LAAYLTCWRVRYTGVLRGLPRLPLVVWAGFDAGLGDLPALVWGTVKTLRVGDLLAGAGASLDTRIDLARGGLALGEGCSAVNKEGAVDWHPIRPRTSITSRLNIFTP